MPYHPLRAPSSRGRQATGGGACETLRSARSPRLRRTAAPTTGIRRLTCSCGPQTSIAGPSLGGRPQLIAQQRLRFLNPVHTLRANDEASIHIWIVREGAAVVAGETDGVQTTLSRLGQRGQQVWRIATGRHRDRDVTGLCAGDQL